ncbi:MAG: hypothetical protein IJV06_12435 [Bacteroidaceae bacterium]|nr:hypothetical protein [Bacteroidaceae bacterium]MBQ9642346.1 hypothetical protein [Bacteroidaceae bacterium]
MKRTVISRLLLAVAALLTISCSGEEAQAQTPSSNMEIYMTIDGQTLPVSLVDNEATQALLAALQVAPLTYEADDYGGFEKVGSLGRSLPTSNSHITTEAGDVILYNGNQMVLFYGSNSWSYTRLGRIQYASLDQLKSFLKAGQGRVSVTLSAAVATDIRSVGATAEKENEFTALNGVRTMSPGRGIYIKNGKKYLK